MNGSKLSHLIKARVCCGALSHLGKGDPDNQNYDDRNAL